MTDEHEPTEQETAIYDALNAGDHDAIDQLRADAYSADQTPPTDKETGAVPEGWLPPAEQFDVDYANAHGHYQADHEAPQEAREAATKVEVHDENVTAAERQEGLT